MPSPMDRALKAEASKRGRTPLPRISARESMANALGDVMAFHRGGGLAGALGMQSAGSRLMQESQRNKETLAKGQVPSLGQEAFDLALNVSPAALAGMIKAFHGTPHKFSKFDINKIGTGEGAQAYGHGLYFAGRKGTATVYRDALTNKNIPAGGPIDKTAFSVVRNAPSKSDTELMPFVRNAFPDASDDEIGQAIVRARSNLQEGNLYTVDIDAHADDLLDWDKPLSQQSEGIRKAFNQLVRQNPLLGNRLSDARRGDTSGRTTYRLLSQNLGPQGTSEALRKAGIKGIRYLDQGSRGAGEGTSNYVVFDDSILDIVD